MPARPSRWIALPATLLLPWLLFACTYSTPGASIAQFPAHQPDIHLHVEIARNTLLTDQVLVNGKKVGWFIIDTGANVSFLDPSALQAAGITPYADAPPNAALPYPIQSLTVGGCILPHTHLVVKSLAAYHFQESYRVPIVGLLGGSLWASTPFTVDYHAAEIVFHDRRSFRPPPNATAIPLHIRQGQILGDSDKLVMWDYGYPTIRADINDVTGAEMLLDTGNPSGIIVLPFLASHNPDWLDTSRRLQAASGITGGEYVPLKNASLTLFGRTIDATPYASAMRGDWTASTPGDQVSMYTGDPGSELAMLGMRVLRNFRLTFDYRAQTLWAQPSFRPSLSERITQGFDINRVDLADRTPLMEAARDADDAEFRDLLRAGARPDIPTDSTSLATEIAAFGTPDMIDALAQAHARIDWNAPSKQGATPLVVSILLGNAAVAERFLALGADPNASFKNLSLLQLAAMCDQPAIFNLLEKAGAHRPGPQDLTLLCVAAAGNAQSMLEILLADPTERAHLETADSSGNTPLLAAALYNHALAARLLLRAGANPHVRNHDGKSPIDIVNALGQKGIALNQALRGQ